MKWKICRICIWKFDIDSWIRTHIWWTFLSRRVDSIERFRFFASRISSITDKVSWIKNVSPPINSQYPISSSDINMNVWKCFILKELQVADRNSFWIFEVQTQPEQTLSTDIFNKYKVKVYIQAKNPCMSMNFILTSGHKVYIEEKCFCITNLPS